MKISHLYRHPYRHSCHCLAYRHHCLSPPPTSMTTTVASFPRHTPGFRANTTADSRFRGHYIIHRASIRRSVFSSIRGTPGCCTITSSGTIACTSESTPVGGYLTPHSSVSALTGLKNTDVTTVSAPKRSIMS
ncbi:hypothetical protein BD779DRAFT_1556020 [Infundibulicybe gibba]|nr:hypothetical protein BD779DRAFT_1556020 [Infundibulicybe gibba]